MNPTTLNGWANIFMLEWDQYVSENPLDLSILDPE
jgi:hypothetical protein